MISDLIRLNGVEIANTARLDAYLDSVGTGLDSVSACGCGSLDGMLLGGDGPYRSPAEDWAPWYDPDVPESAGFAGFLPLSMDGIDVYPAQRTTTAAATGGAAIGPARVQPLEIVISGLILGNSCCAVDYGFRWLAAALEGCDGSACAGSSCLEVLSCCPSDVDGLSAEEFNRHYRRTLRRVALTDGPKVTARTGSDCTGPGSCSLSADVLTVEFTLTAAVPWAWTDAQQLLDVPLPRDPDGGCITWCLHTRAGGESKDGGGSGKPPAFVCLVLDDERGGCPAGTVSVPFTEDCADGESDGPGGWPASDGAPVDPCAGACRLADCTEQDEACDDPACSSASPPLPAAPQSCWCLPLAVEAACYDLDLTTRARVSGDAPLITVEAGSAPLRDVTLTFYERRSNDLDHMGLSCEEIAEVERCTPHSQYTVQYVPAGGTMTLDGQIGRAVIQCEEDGPCLPATGAWGEGGGPPSWRLLDCDRYVLEVTSNAWMPPAEDARVTVAVSGRGY